MSERATMSGKPVFTVPAKTVVNFDSRFDKKLLCDGITFTTGNACVYGCAFCYVDAMQKKAMDWHKNHGVIYPPSGHSGVVIRIANAVEIARKQIMSKPVVFRMAKKTIYASPKVDVAGNMELVRETAEICKVILELTNWDIRLLSKSNLLPKVAEKLTDWGREVARTPLSFSRNNEVIKSRIIYGVSTGTLDDNLAAAFEQGTAKVSKRIESLHWLQDNGFRTFGMICPSLPQSDYQQWAIEMERAIRGDRCENVWAEIINLRGESFTKTESALANGGYISDALELRRVSRDKDQWEEYARETFNAHAPLYSPGKLRFLQYVTKNTAPWWESQKQNGAIVL